VPQTLLCRYFCCVVDSHTQSERVRERERENPSNQYIRQWEAPSLAIKASSRTVIVSHRVNQRKHGVETTTGVSACIIHQIQGCPVLLDRAARIGFHIDRNSVEYRD
jgi:hypothetical protein